MSSYGVAKVDQEPELWINSPMPPAQSTSRLSNFQWELGKHDSPIQFAMHCFEAKYFECEVLSSIKGLKEIHSDSVQISQERNCISQYQPHNHENID